ncbi:MAG: chlorophyll synthesis pathway protein BchC [Rhodoblastus sp.]
MNTVAVVLNAPQSLALREIELTQPGDGDVVVDVAWSGISTGTERLLWDGRMPPFPGMGYPLVPGYESVGRVTQAGPSSGMKVGQTVFVPGARCYGEVHGLFGGAASRVVTPASRVIPIPEGLRERGVLMALAATAHHAVAGGLPDLIVGHGVLGRLIARIAVAQGGAPVVWEKNAQRAGGSFRYAVTTPENDPRRNYQRICDVSGDSKLLDALIQRLAPAGEIVLAGFYSEPLSFSFPPAFMREARIRIAAEWKPDDLVKTRALVESGRLSLDGLITHKRSAEDAADAYRLAFDDPSCLKMILEWRKS